MFPSPQAFLWPWCPVERRLSSLTFGSLPRGSSARSRSANMPLCPESPQQIICLMGLQHIKSVTQTTYRDSTLRIIFYLMQNYQPINIIILQLDFEVVELVLWMFFNCRRIRLNMKWIAHQVMSNQCYLFSSMCHISAINLIMFRSNNNAKRMYMLNFD